MATKHRTLDQIRTDIETCRARIDQVGTAVLPLDAALERLRQWVEAQAEAWQPPVSGFAHATPMHFRLFLEGQPVAAPDLTSLLCGVFPDAVYEALATRLETHYAALDGPEMLTPAEKDKTLAALREDLYALEIEEEACIRALEAQGQTPLRRPDIEHLAVVLAE
jgi:hypothetical protein